jgi:hypothetical protein
VENAKDWGGKGETHDYLKRKVFFKNQKHEANIVEITHLCIMHGVHTSITYCAKISINWVQDETKAHLQYRVIVNYGRIYRYIYIGEVPLNW